MPRRRDPQCDGPRRGARAGISMHQRYGKLPWKDLFQPAIAFAEQGYPVHEGMHEIWAAANIVRGLKANAESARVFLPEGSRRRPGSFSAIPTWAALSARRGERPRRILQGRNRRSHSQDVATPRRHDDRRRSRRIFSANGWNPFRSIIVAGASMSCLPMGRELPRSRC